MGEQLELFFDTPFSLRLTIEEAMRVFRENYWNHLPFGRNGDAICSKILNFFKGKYLDTITKADVERMRRFYKEMKYSESTINKIHMTGSRLISKWYEYKEGKFLNGLDVSRVVLPARNPFSQVPRVNERQFARKLEITKERKMLLCSFADEDMYEIIDTLYWSMLRQWDMFSITSKNVDIERMVINGIQGKTITTRNPSGLPYKVVIPADRLDVIKRRLESTKPGTPLFRRRNLQKRWHKVRYLAATIDPELAEAQLRDIRGGATSFLLDNGVDLETVRKKGGWASVEMIPRYDKRSEKPLRKATEKLVEV